MADPAPLTPAERRLIRAYRLAGPRAVARRRRLLVVTAILLVVAAIAIVRGPGQHYGVYRQIVARGSVEAATKGPRRDDTGCFSWGNGVFSSTGPPNALALDRVSVWADRHSWHLLVGSGFRGAVTAHIHADGQQRITLQSSHLFARRADLPKLPSDAVIFQTAADGSEFTVVNPRKPVLVTFTTGCRAQHLTINLTQGQGRPALPTRQIQVGDGRPPTSATITSSRTGR